MILRAKFPKLKDVMLVNDTPFKTEVPTGDKFSSVANMNLLTSLRTGKINNYGKVAQDVSYQGINSVNIFTTYLDYNYFEEGNFDFWKELKKRKDLNVVKTDGVETYFDSTDTEFYKLENQKDVFVAERLWTEFQHLLIEINLVKPKLIILTGKWSLFFLTGCSSLVSNLGNAKDRKPLGALNKFRSSIMSPSECYDLNYIEEGEETFSPILIPIFHTLHAISMPDKLSTMVLDIEKLGWMYGVIKDKGVGYFKKPDKEYILGTEKEIILTYLNSLLERLDEKPRLVSIDIETFYYSLIDCIGITDSVDSGICIPFAHKGNANYWNLEDETEILCKLREVMLHTGCLHVGQNYSYDSQFFHKFWYIDVNATYDSMILHHVLYNYLPKNLGFLASLYSTHYSYWKEDITATEEDPSTRWIYNVKDIQHTLEVTEVLLDILDKQPEKMKEFYNFQQHGVSPALVQVMNRGIKVDLDKKQDLHNKLSVLLTHIETSIDSLLGEHINIKSSHQIKKLFIDLLNVDPVINRKSKTASFGSDAMLVYLEEYPIYRPLITLILEYRSIGVFVRTFLSAKVDDDDKMRTSYNVAGTKTYRLASRKNAFGAGMNIQNIPSKGKIDLKYSLMSVTEEEDDAELDNIDSPVYGSTELPNCKELFICEDDEMFFDIDLAAADARIISWVSGCKFLTELFEDPEGDPYLLLAREYYRNPNLNKKSKERQIFKAVNHATNYLGRPNTISAKAGLLVHEVEQIQKFYFSLCPEIPKLHKEVEAQVYGRGYIENVWGARGWFLNKNDPMILNQAMAWVGSSPVGILINKGLVSISDNDKAIQIRLQVHDSLAGTFKKTDITAPERIIKHCSIPLPFEIPRIIPVDIKTSNTSYGNCG
jgi:DNA polymerase I-like protein with 3'-5' exonuclease and polymerase domains